MDDTDNLDHQFSGDFSEDDNQSAPQGSVDNSFSPGGDEERNGDGAGADETAADQGDAEGRGEKLQRLLAGTDFRHRFPVIDRWDRLTEIVRPNLLAANALSDILARSPILSPWQDYPGFASLVSSMNAWSSVIDSYTGPMVSNLGRTLEEIQRSWAPTIDQIIPNFLTNFTYPNFAEQLRKALEQRVIPDNLGELGVTVDDLDDIAQTLHDGIPLYWVPRARIARRLITATTIQQRRKVIGDEIPAIIDDCLDALELVSSRDYLYEADRVREASELVLTHPAAAQALAMTILDSLMFQVRVRSSDVRGLILEEKNRMKDGHEEAAREALQDVLGYRGVLALAPVRPLFKQFRTTDPPSEIPRPLNRHATLHRVHPYQYSKRNATIALMMASSVLVYMSRWFETELEQAERRRRTGS
ncbi:hypothetical protein [Brachybacterium sp. UNK5269]|uniref:hypothetical protein n=1 Tax=Brachybacterium sp. UNK5269 TaxID=3408576 RepID=UPI003BAEE968